MKRYCTIEFRIGTEASEAKHSPFKSTFRYFPLNDPFSHSIGPVLVPLILPSSRDGKCLIWGSHKMTTKDRAKRRLWTQKRSWKVQTFAKLQANHSVIGWSFWCDKIYNCVHTKPPYNVYFYAPCRASLIWWCGTQKTLRPGTQWWKHSSRALGRPSRLGQFNVMCRSKIGSLKII